MIFRGISEIIRDAKNARAFSSYFFKANPIAFYRPGYIMYIKLVIYFWCIFSNCFLIGPSNISSILSFQKSHQRLEHSTFRPKTQATLWKCPALDPRRQSIAVVIIRTWFLCRFPRTLHSFNDDTNEQETNEMSGDILFTNRFYRSQGNEGDSRDLSTDNYIMKWGKYDVPNLFMLKCHLNILLIQNELLPVKVRFKM